jgi:hypothetical protein
MDRGGAELTETRSGSVGTTLSRAIDVGVGSQEPMNLKRTEKEKENNDDD